MERMMTGLFGASWRTSLMGLVGGMFYYFQQQGVDVPHDLHGWVNAVIAAGIYAWGRVQKDGNVSNAPTPAPPKPVQ